MVPATGLAARVGRAGAALGAGLVAGTNVLAAFSAMILPRGAFPKTRLGGATLDVGLLISGPTMYCHEVGAIRLGRKPVFLGGVGPK